MRWAREVGEPNYEDSRIEPVDPGAGSLPWRLDDRVPCRGRRLGAPACDRGHTGPGWGEPSSSARARADRRPGVPGGRGMKTPISRPGPRFIAGGSPLRSSSVTSRWALRKATGRAGGRPSNFSRHQQGKEHRRTVLQSDQEVPRNRHPLRHRPLTTAQGPSWPEPSPSTQSVVRQARRCLSPHRGDPHG